MEAVITQAPYNSNTPVVSFDKSEIDGFVWEKGLSVLKEKSIKCPCKSRDTNQLSNCKNCGGTGWVYINPTKTNMVLHSMNLTTGFKEWSEERVGTVSITALNEEELAFMDRITVCDGNSIFNETLSYLQVDNTLFFSTVYNIKEILYIALFVNASSPLRRLNINVDYTFDKNFIVLDNKFLDPNISDENRDLSISIRYKHAPQFHVIDIPRDIAVVKVKTGGTEKSPVYLPIHCVGRRSHYVLSAENLSGTRLINNSYSENCESNPKSNICC